MHNTLTAEPGRRGHRELLSGKEKTRLGFLNIKACHLQMIDHPCLIFILWHVAPCCWPTLLLVFHYTMLQRPLHFQGVCAQWLRFCFPSQSPPEAPWDAPSGAEATWFLGRINTKSSLLEDLFPVAMQVQLMFFNIVESYKGEALRAIITWITGS